MQFKKRFASLALALALTACDLKAFAPDDASKTAAQQAYAELVTGQDDVLLKDMQSDMAPAQQRMLLNVMRTLIPDGPGQAGDLVGFNTNIGTNGHTLDLTYRYPYGAQQVIFTATLNRAHDSDPWKIVGVHVRPATKSEVDSPSYGKLSTAPPTKTGLGLPGSQVSTN